MAVDDPVFAHGDARVLLPQVSVVLGLVGEEGVAVPAEQVHPGLHQQRVPVRRVAGEKGPVLLLAGVAVEDGRHLRYPLPVLAGQFHPVEA